MTPKEQYEQETGKKPEYTKWLESEIVRLRAGVEYLKEHAWDALDGDMANYILEGKYLTENKK